MSIYLSPEYFFRYELDHFSSSSYSDLLPMCCSIDNYFIPIFAGIDGSYIHHEQKKALIYNLKLASSSIIRIPRTASRLVNLLHHSKPRILVEGNLSNTIRYQTMKHFIYMNNNNSIIPLYALCCGNKDIYDLDRSNPDYRKFFLLLNPLLFTSDHKFLASRIKPLIKYFQQLHVNIIYTENISDLCLKENTFKNNFRSIDERSLFIRSIKERVGLYVPPLPQSEVIPEPIITPTEQVISESVSEQATGIINLLDPTFVEGLRTSRINGTTIPPNLNHFGVTAPVDGWTIPTVNDLNAAAPQNLGQEFGQAIIYGTGNPDPEYTANFDPASTFNQVPVNDGVVDNTVINAATHERVQASFIDRSSFPLREVEFDLVDDLEEFMEQVAPLPYIEPIPEPVVTGPRPDPSILNDPSLLTNVSTNIQF